MAAEPIRIIHFSDIHLTAPRLGWERRDWLGKRLTGWMNIKLLGRGRRFRYAVEAATVLVHRIHAAKQDGVIFSDATKLGFPSEFRKVEELLAPADERWPAAVAVPGNHDYYVPEAAASNAFETTFAPWQRGTRIGSHAYPFLRSIGPVHVIALNGATANAFHLDAGGAIGDDQLQRMRALCADLPPGIRVVVVHYPLRTAAGELEPKLRRLRDHEAALSVAADCGVQLWLHGHIHRPFVRGACDAVPFPMICTGSATQCDRWSYHEYTIRGLQLVGVRFTYKPDERNYFESDRFSLTLPDDPLKERLGLACD